jgi:hypothetical protein
VVLSEPSVELATRLLSRLGVEERLVGTKMSPMSGVQQYPIHGFREAVNFLKLDSAAEVLSWGPRASVPYVDPKVLQLWVQEVFRDTDLAEAIGEVIGEGDSYAGTIGRARELMKHRLDQCEALLEDGTTD